MDYKESIITGTQWTRSNIVVVNNDYGKTPKITFGEETRIAIGDGSIQASTGTVMCNFDPETTFHMLNPTTNEPTGDSVSHAALYAQLYSLYMHLANLRDNPPQIEIPEL